LPLQAGEVFHVPLLSGPRPHDRKGGTNCAENGGIPAQGASASGAMLYRSVGGDVSGWPIFDAAAPVLPGLAAPPEFVF